MMAQHITFNKAIKVICWAIIFITRIRFPPGKSLATITEQSVKAVNKMPHRKTSPTTCLSQDKFQFF